MAGWLLFITKSICILASAVQTSSLMGAQLLLLKHICR